MPSIAARTTVESSRPSPAPELLLAMPSPLPRAALPGEPPLAIGWVRNGAADVGALISWQ